MKNNVWWAGSLFSGNSSDADAVDEEEYEKTSRGDTKYRGMVHNHFKSLVGADVAYYGADGAEHSFNVDNIVFKVLEDPNDGYRSCLGVIEYGEQNNSIFFRSPIARVRIEMFHESTEYGHENEGYRLIDIEDGHVWLEFGTNHYDDYYPMFVFSHFPKAV